MDEYLFVKHQLYPACLPLEESNNYDAIHSGWSTPPPIEYLWKYAPLYVPFHEDFFKQWHHRMYITECRDPPISSNFPTDTYYPPGLICANEDTLSFCPTSGESGSPLMVKEKPRPERYAAKGILSFTKGCVAFIFGALPNHNALGQVSLNPTVYTKLSCFLPWIAQQYSLEFDKPNELDPACVEGTGDFNDIADQEDPMKICRTNPSNALEAASFPELPCIFPYYLDDKLIENSCIQFDIENLNYPTFVCPIRNITQKYPGTKINSFTSDFIANLTNPLLGSGADEAYLEDIGASGANDEIYTGLCEDENAQQPGDTLPPLNTAISCKSSKLRNAFSLCKNNCPGGTKNHF